MERILAANLGALMAAHPELRTQAAVAAATRKAGLKIDQKTVSRILKADHAVQIDTLQAIAAAFGIEPYQLLVPGLNPTNPQVLRVLSPQEERLYSVLQEAMKGTQ